jgi:hypothetical protein
MLQLSKLLSRSEVVMTRKPHVLIVDDKPDGERAQVSLSQGNVEFSVEHPQGVTEHDLNIADLVLVDYVLEDWPERDSAGSIGLQPLNGLALAAVLREHACRDFSRESPTAFAIRSAHLNELSGDLPPEFREHIIAKTHNLEWVFPKTSSGVVPVIDQITALAGAVHQLPSSWPESTAEEIRDIVNGLLALPDQPWIVRAQENIEDCHPPLQGLSEASHGLAFLRWLLHSILPYPCFLWDMHYVAARFRVTYASIAQALQQDDDLESLLQPFSYRGILADFLGWRWWRAGIESFVFDLTDGDPFNIELLHDRLASQVRFELEPIEQSQPVVCLDVHYRPLPEFSSIEDAVRVQPDDWPPFADQAWTTVALAKENPPLGAMVVSQDRNRLD